MMHYVSHHTNSKLRVEQSTAPALSPWQKLANAIVEQAVKDYRMEQARVKAIRRMLIMRRQRSGSWNASFVPTGLRF